MAKTQTPPMIVDRAVSAAATEAGRCRMNMRIRKMPEPHVVDVAGGLEILQNFAECDDPELSTNDRLAFREAFGVELTDETSILVLEGFDESIKLPSGIRHRLLAHSDDSITDMDQLHAV